jgi:hypothetical protein
MKTIVALVAALFLIGSLPAQAKPFDTIESGGYHKKCFYKYYCDWKYCYYCKVCPKYKKV